MATEVNPPDFNFSGQYYPEIYSDLVAYMRNNIPELSDEDPAEPAVQMLKAFAMVGHICNTLLDLVAVERFLPTARLRASVAAHLALIDYQLEQAKPAKVDIVAKLTKVFDTDLNLIPVNSLFSTQAARGTEAVAFEVLKDVFVTRGDAVRVLAYMSALDQYEELSGPGFMSWGGALAAGDMLYIGHPELQFDTVTFNMPVAGVDIVEGVWEYYDGDYEDAQPDNVANQGGYIKMELSEWLGIRQRTGARVRVRSNITGAYEDVISQWDGTHNFIETSGNLGQVTISLEASDYTVGSLWQELDVIQDETSAWGNSGEVLQLIFELPQSVVRKWLPATVGGAENEVHANWIRFRVVVTTGSPMTPTISDINITQGGQYLVFTATQGVSRRDEPLGSSDSTRNQTHQLRNYPVIDDATLRVWVDEGSGEEEWPRVRNFLNSTPLDRHFRVDFDDAGRALIVFGDGANGKIPNVGNDNVVAAYRTITDVNGNVSGNTVNVNRAGISYFDRIYNPRAANGWLAAQGSTAEDLERVKLIGPASLRIRSRGVTASDIEILAAEYVDANGTKPIGRALVVEEGMGPKTVKLIVASPGGSGLTQDTLAELQDYFNGEEGRPGVLLLNHELTAANFMPKVIDVEAVIVGGNKLAIETALASLLSPVARADDGVAFRWAFGENVSRSQIIATIMRASPAPRNATLIGPAADVLLESDELPLIGSMSITIIG